MSRTQRTRQRSVVVPNGTKNTYLNGSYAFAASPSNFTRSSGVCTDYSGRPVSDGSLDLTLVDRSKLVPLNGQSAPSGWYSVCQDYIPYYTNFSAISHASGLSIPAASDSMTSLIARTNPSRPGVTPLTLLQDLKDIPRQLRDVGKLLRSPKKILSAKEAANQYLGFQFGWLPLIKDVQDLLDLQSSIDKRLGELHRLYSDKGLRRRIPLGNWGAADQSVESLDTLGLFDTLHGTVSKHSSAKRWGVVRWLPNPLPGYRPTDADMINQARRVVGGLSLEGLLKGGWDIIPWTWIINWFTNVAEFAMQYSNTVPASPSSASIMTKITTFVVINPTDRPIGMTGGGGSYTIITKQRYVGASSVSVTLPFIGLDRLSILSALFVQRFK